MRRKVALLLTTIAAALVAASGIALALNVTCEPGNSESDPCLGTTGDDLITGTTGGDYITALEGVDTVNARGGEDRVFGGGARDTLEGAGGLDLLYGEAGADTLNEGPNSGGLSYVCGGSGNDRLNGGTGPDQYGFGPGWGKDTILGEETDPPPSEAGVGEYLSFRPTGRTSADISKCGVRILVPLTINLATGVAFETAAGPTGVNTLSFTAPQIENVSGGSGDDTIKGNRLPNHIIGMEGNDTINVRDGRENDFVECFEGEDRAIVDVGGGDWTFDCEIVDDTIGYNAVEDFAATLNPSGAWSYGYLASGGTTFTKYTEHDNPVAGIDRWSPAGATEPMVARNNTGQPITWSTIVHPPDVLNVHPGPSGEKSVVRWTAPSAGTVKIEGRFEGIDNGGTTTDGDGTTTDVAVVKNSNTATPLFSADVNGFEDKAPFSETTSVTAGATINFVVDYDNAAHVNDSTGLSVMITPTQ